MSVPNMHKTLEQIDLPQSKLTRRKHQPLDTVNVGVRYKEYVLCL